jgi:hypothetical protein
VWESNTREDSLEQTISAVIEGEDRELKHQSIQIQDGNLSVSDGIDLSVIARKTGNEQPLAIGRIPAVRSWYSHPLQNDM